MTSESKGVWSATVKKLASGTAYSYRLTFADGTVNTSADPYATAAVANGERSVVLSKKAMGKAGKRMPAFGKTADEVRAEGTPEEIVPARVFTGNRPTTSIFGVALTPFALGELIALYEHITFVEGTVWGLDSYDQWGVELGKQLAKQITPAISKDDDALAAQDPSTQSLIKFYRANREF